MLSNGSDLKFFFRAVPSTHAIVECTVCLMGP